MKRKEEIEIATATYINGRLKNNVPPEEIEEIRLAYQAGAIYADEHPDLYTATRKAVTTALRHLWHDAHGDVLPEYESEVIVLCDKLNGVELVDNDVYVAFGHRPNPDGWWGKPVGSNEPPQHYQPKTYGKGGWNIPDVKWWLDVELPMEEQQ